MSSNFVATRTVAISDSTLLSKIEYNHEARIMRLHFIASQSVWEYKNVWPNDFAQLVSAYSVGKLFNKRIRPRLVGVRISDNSGHRKQKPAKLQQQQLPL